LAALVVGALVALQSRINAELAQYVGGALIAATITFGTGLVLALAIVAAKPALRRGFRTLRAALGQGRLRWWQLLGGLGGAWLVTTQGMVITVVGVTVFTVAVVAGQVSGSLVADRLGLSPAGVLPITGRRAAAALVAFAAVVVSGLTHVEDGAGIQVGVAVALAVTAGLGISIQQAINGRVSQASGQAMVAATVNFIVGMTALVVATTLLLALNVIAFGTWAPHWWLYVGGPIGLAFIALAAWAVHSLGVLTFGLLAIAGQLLGSVVLDLVVPATTTDFDYLQIVGLALVAVAVWLAAAKPKLSPTKPE